MITGKRRILYSASIFTLLLAIFAYFLSGTIFCFLGEFLVLNETPEPSDAVVVLSTGMEYYPRLMEAAQLYRKKLVKKVVINGNRKTEALRNLERMSITECGPWYEESFRILELLGVPRDEILAVSAETPSAKQKPLGLN